MESAKEALLTAIMSLDPSELPEFSSWVRSVLDEVDTGLYEGSTEDSDIGMAEEDDQPALQNLKRIADDLREKLPLSAMAPEETTFYLDHEGVGRPECDGTFYLHLDHFLYSDGFFDTKQYEDYLETVSNAHMATCTCRKSHVPCIISHSMSLAQINHLYRTLLPDLEGKQVLDVGSRLGAILFGGFYLSNATKLTGVEMNSHFCSLSQSMIKKYSMGSRVEVIAADIGSRPDILRSADVIILNNVFEHFAPKPQQTDLWHIIRNTVTRKGVIIVSIPSLHESQEKCKADIDVDNWVMEETKILDDEGLHDSDNLQALRVYRVK